MQQWSDAMATALYGPCGFYTTGAGPAAHFRTSVTASRVLAEGLAVLVQEVDELLDRPDPFQVVDVGAGDGRLLAHLRDALPASTSLPDRLRLVAVERGRRRDTPDSATRWEPAVPDGVVGLVVAHELLDNVPVDVVCVADSGRQYTVLVDEQANEQLGGEPTPTVTDWITRWWPLGNARPGDRAEVGTGRDALWHDVVAGLRRGVALAVDYGHDRDGRVAGRWAQGTLAAYREGRQVPLRLDGSCDVTAHVALDACAAAGCRGGAEHELLLSQREALGRLGVRAERPALTLATSSPLQYLQGLQRVGEVHEVMDPTGLGGFTWLLQSKGCPLPTSLAAPGA